MSTNSRLANSGSSVASRAFVRVASLRPGGGLGRSWRVEKRETYSLHVAGGRKFWRSRIWEGRTVIGMGVSAGGGIGGKAIWMAFVDGVVDGRGRFILAI